MGALVARRLKVGWVGVEVGGEGAWCVCWGWVDGGDGCLGCCVCLFEGYGENFGWDGGLFWDGSRGGS
jgi:hypothetical protein